MDSFQMLSVGTRYPEWNTGEEGFTLEWGDGGFILYAKLNGISPHEKQQFLPEEKMTVRYTVIDDVCYFTFLFGSMPWADCPFSPELYKGLGKDVDFPELENNDGYALTVLLIDTSTGELLQIRLVGLGHSFSETWHQWATEALKKPISVFAYQSQINSTYARYTSINLADKALREQHEYIIFGG